MKNIEISLRKSEADVQYELVKSIEKLNIKWLSIMQECSITISHVVDKKYYKTDKATRNLFKIDVLLKRWEDILFIEVKRSKAKSLKARSYITAQVNKYKELWYICLLCEWVSDIKNTLVEVNKFFSKNRIYNKPKYRKKT